MSADTTSQSQRWTPDRIRKAAPFPKPKGEINKALPALRRALDTVERRALRVIAGVPTASQVRHYRSHFEAYTVKMMKLFLKTTEKRDELFPSPDTSLSPKALP